MASKLTNQNMSQSSAMGPSANIKVMNETAPVLNPTRPASERNVGLMMNPGSNMSSTRFDTNNGASSGVSSINQIVKGI